mgnify:CR=1 FL=1
MGEIRNLSEYEKQQRDAYNDALRLLNEQREIIAERDAEIEAHEKREAAYMAFVEADDALQDLHLEQQIGMMSWEWERLQEKVDKAAIVKAKARRRLREVMDDQ